MAITSFTFACRKTSNLKNPLNVSKMLLYWVLFVRKSFPYHVSNNIVSPQTMLSQLRQSTAAWLQRSVPPPLSRRPKLTHQHKHKPACLTQNQEEARIQGQENKAWMRKGILSHVSTFRSKLWQTGFGPLCTWSLSQGRSVMGSDLGLMPWSAVRQKTKSTFYFSGTNEEIVQ